MSACRFAKVGWNILHKIIFIVLAPELFRNKNLFGVRDKKKVAAGPFILLTVDGNIYFCSLDLEQRIYMQQSS